MNKEARQMIAVEAERRGLTRCELCGGTFGLAPAHRHKRIHYQTAAELADPQEWIALCQECHQKIEDSRALTEETFKHLRP